MKHYIVIATFLFLLACTKKNQIEVIGNTPGIKNGVFIIKNLNDSIVYGENIKNGKFLMTNKQLKYAGYYSLDITNSDSTDGHAPFEIYLDVGTYKIETEKGKLYKYPKIISSSKIQTELSAYHKLADQIESDAIEKDIRLKEELKKNENKLSIAAYTKLVNEIVKADLNLNSLSLVVLTQFVKKFPQSQITAHLMAKLDYSYDPVAYYKLYKTFSEASKKSEEGIELGTKLSHMVLLVKGAKAPSIYGNTPQGDTFDYNSINKKVILVEFWRASNEMSRRNHQNIIDYLANLSDKKKLGVVSISMDTKKDWWLNAINQDHLNWIQISDLRGDDSPNTVNWSISRMPTYYLLTGNWHVIIPNLSLDRLDFEMNYYLKHHN